MANNKDKKILNVPALRFPEFTEEWKNTTLRNECSINPTSDKLKDEFVYVDLESVEKGELTKKQVIEKENAPSRAQRVLRNGDVLFQCVRPYQRNNYLVKNVSSEVQWVASTGYAQLRTERNNPAFIYHLLNTSSFNKKVIVRCTGSSYPAINSDDLSKIHFYICGDIEEQKRIADFLTLLDERIATQNKIIEDLKKLKSAIADKLYSSTKGETYSFRQLFDVINERNKKLTYSNVLSASQELGMIERSDINKDIKFEQDSISGYKIVRNGDYVVHLRSFQGGFAFSDRTGICSPAYTILHPNDLVAYGYLSHFFISKPFIKSLKLVTYGIRDGRSINVDEWLDMTVTLPTKREQSHILAIINAIDNKLHNENQIHNYMFRQRTYLLCFDKGHTC